MGRKAACGGRAGLAVLNRETRQRWGEEGDGGDGWATRAAEDNNAAGEEERRRAAARRGRDAARSANVLGDFLGIGVPQAAANSTHATDMGDLGIGDAGSDLYAAGPEWTWAHGHARAHP